MGVESRFSGNMALCTHGAGWRCGTRVQSVVCCVFLFAIAAGDALTAALICEFMGQLWGRNDVDVGVSVDGVL